MTRNEDFILGKCGTYWIRYDKGASNIDHTAQRKALNAYIFKAVIQRRLARINKLAAAKKV